MDLPDDLIIDPAAETAIRRDLVQVALGRQAADCVLRVGRLFDSGTATWMDDAEIVIRGRRVAFVGPAGAWTGTAQRREERRALSAAPGFGEVHKHIESSHLTPEHAAALVLPRGNTWTCEASHELSNVNGAGNLEFWLAARRAGSPLKIFPLPGSATPPTGYERSGGHFGQAEQAAFMAHPMVAGLDEVMDWPAVTDADNPAHARLWGMIEATLAARGVVEGHAAGLRDLANINAFAAAGLSSDHEAWTAEEAWDKLRRGLFLEIRPHSMPEIIAGLLERGLRDWSQVAFATDDSGASEPLVADGARYIGETPDVAWPGWARESVRLPRALEAADFAIAPQSGRDSMQAAVLRPFHWEDAFLTETLAVDDGAVQRDPARQITKFAVIDRHSGAGTVGAMFWRGCGPRTAETAVGCTVGHDSHNLWVVGSSDAAMAQVANAIRAQQGGWALATGGAIVATVRYEIGGLMTARPAEALDAEWWAFLAAADKIDWFYEPSSSPRWGPGFPERLQFATLTCAPWRWVLVAPNDAAPTGLVNVATGESHPVVW